MNDERTARNSDVHDIGAYTTENQNTSAELFNQLSDLDVLFLDENTEYRDDESSGPLLSRKKEWIIRNEEFKRKLNKWLAKKRSDVKHKIKKQRLRIRKNLNDPNFVMTIDKISFVTGILIIMVTEAFLFLSPSQLPSLYTMLLVPLLLMRYYLYRKDKMHYFMYDFCYYQQILLLLQIYSFPASSLLFKVNFALANGPLVIAVILWRNSLVFHSVDKMTSSMIHILPAVVMFSLKWEDNLLHHRFPLWDESKHDHSNSSYLLDFMCHPFLFYLLWQLLYLLKTEVISRQKLSNDTEIMTSLRWLQQKATHTKSYKIINQVFGPGYHLIGFVLYQGFYTILTLLPIPLFWNSMRIHTFYLSAIFIQALINGATYYFQIFASRYIEDLQRKSGKEVRVSSKKKGNQEKS